MNFSCHQAGVHKDQAPTAPHWVKILQNNAGQDHFIIYFYLFVKIITKYEIFMQGESRNSELKLLTWNWNVIVL